MKKFCDNPKCLLHTDVYSDEQTSMFYMNNKDEKCWSDRHKYITYKRDPEDPYRILHRKDLFFCEVCKEAIELVNKRL